MSSTSPPHRRPHTGRPAGAYTGAYDQAHQGWHSWYDAQPPRGASYHWQLRTSQAERENVVEQLSNAFADGRLDQQEFDRRMHEAMTARTHADLAPLLADLPITGPAPTPMPPPMPTPPAPTANDRTLGALCHLSALFASFVGPLILLLTAGRDSAFVRNQAAESLNFQLTFMLANVMLVPVAVLTLGLGALLYIPLGIGWFVLVLIGSATPILGRAYRYPLNLRLIR